MIFEPWNYPQSGCKRSSGWEIPRHCQTNAWVQTRLSAQYSQDGARTVTPRHLPKRKQAMNRFHVWYTMDPNVCTMMRCIGIQWRHHVRPLWHVCQSGCSILLWRHYRWSSCSIFMRIHLQEWEENQKVFGWTGQVLCWSQDQFSNWFVSGGGSPSYKEPAEMTIRRSRHGHYLLYACGWAQSLTLSNLQIWMVTRTWQGWILSAILGVWYSDIKNNSTSHKVLTSCFMQVGLKNDDDDPSWTWTRCWTNWRQLNQHCKQLRPNTGRTTINVFVML